MPSSASTIPELLDQVREAVVNLDPKHLASLEQGYARLTETLADAGIPRPSERDLHVMLAAAMMYRSFALNAAEEQHGTLGRKFAEPFVEEASRHFLLVLGATPMPLSDEGTGLPPSP